MTPNPKTTQLVLTRQARKKLADLSDKLAADLGPRDAIPITPALRAALIRLRDADAESEATYAREAPNMGNPRLKSTREAEGRYHAASQRRRDAIEALLAILNPNREGV
jgi:hypothetical protein